MVFGVSACLTISPVCIVAGIWQCTAGFLLILIEVRPLPPTLALPSMEPSKVLPQAPFCCMFLDFVESFARLVEDRPAWQKMALYLV